MSATRGAIAVSGGARQREAGLCYLTKERADICGCAAVAIELVAGGETGGIDGYLYMTGGVGELWHSRVAVRDRCPQ